MGWASRIACVRRRPKDHDLARPEPIHALLVPALALGLLLALFSRSAALLFTSFPPVVDAAAMAMPFAGLCVPLMAWTLGNVNMIRALGHTRWDMHTNLTAAIVIQLPVGWLLAHVAGLGLAGAFLGVVSYWAARAVLTEIIARRLVVIGSGLNRLERKNAGDGMA